MVGREYARLAQGASLRTDVDPEVVIDLVFGALLSRLLATGEPPTAAIVDQVLDIVLRGVRLNEPPIVGEQPTATNRRR